MTSRVCCKLNYILNKFKRFFLAGTKICAYSVINMVPIEVDRNRQSFLSVSLWGYHAETMLPCNIMFVCVAIIISCMYVCHYQWVCVCLCVYMCVHVPVSVYECEYVCDSILRAWNNVWVAIFFHFTIYRKRFSEIGQPLATVNCRRISNRHISHNLVSTVSWSLPSLSEKTIRWTY